MSPHRLTVARRYRISDDILILILEKLDLQALLAMCKAFKRVYVIIMEFQPLRYRFELALAGMKDGPLSYRASPPLSRLQLLDAYKKGWPKLSWIHELSQPVMMDVGVSGGFLYNVRTHDHHSELRISQLPSLRTNLTPASTRHIKFLTNRFEAVVIDPSQAFLVTAHVAHASNGVVIQLNLRNVWTLDKHPKAPNHIYEFPVPLAAEYARINDVALSVCGAKLAISAKFVGGRFQHLLLDWQTFQYWLFTDHSIAFLNENQLLAAKHSNGRPVLNLYNISRVADITVEREYELPEGWNDFQIEICNNIAPSKDLQPGTQALFYPDPSARMICVIAKRAVPPGSPPVHCKWLFVSHSYFRPSRRSGLTHVAWAQWGNHCLIREISQMGPIKGPYFIGTRLVFLEPHNNGGLPRLHTVSFVPYDAWKVSSSPWSWRGPKVIMAPSEYSRDIPEQTACGMLVEDFRMTEDNIILFLNDGHGNKLANILTFGTPSAPH
ncbi:hypothetical protein JOM56_007579 [Amanita muscaria]